MTGINFPSWTFLFYFLYLQILHGERVLRKENDKRLIYHSYLQFTKFHFGGFTPRRCFTKKS